MQVYGYQQRVADEEFGLLQMREITFDATAAELRAVAAFILDCAERFESRDWRSSHRHMTPAMPGVEIIVCQSRGPDDSK